MSAPQLVVPGIAYTLNSGQVSGPFTVQNTGAIPVTQKPHGHYKVGDIFKRGRRSGFCIVTKILKEDFVTGEQRFAARRILTDDGWPIKKGREFEISNTSWSSTYIKIYDKAEVKSFINIRQLELDRVSNELNRLVP